MKGIVLAGGSGTRLYPITRGVCKQLLPIYNKPMIYYSLSVLLLAHIRDILIITTPEDQSAFQRLLGDGSDLGVSFSYAVQRRPRGIAEAFLLGKPFIDGEPVCLILGDNIFYGNELSSLLMEARERTKGATLFGYRVEDPHRYGIIELDSRGVATAIEEKPAHPRSNIAVTGLYFYDEQVISMAEQLSPSARGELEITDINRMYLEQQQLHLSLLGRGFAWLDAGTYGSLMQAGQFVQAIEERGGIPIAALEEIAYRQGFIDADQLCTLAYRMEKSPYGAYLRGIATQDLESLVHVG